MSNTTFLGLPSKKWKPIHWPWTRSQISTTAKSAYQFQKKHRKQLVQTARIASDIAGGNYYQAFLKTLDFPPTRKTYSPRTPYRVQQAFRRAQYQSRRRYRKGYKNTRTRYYNRRRRYGGYKRKRVPYWIWLRNKRRYKRYSKKYY